jgi:hypothetical protein
MMAVAFAPAAASAVVMISVERVEVVPTGADQTVFLDVYLVDLDNTNERLNAYGLIIHGPANSPGGVRFTQPTRLLSAAHPYVFKDFAGYEPLDLDSNHSTLVVSIGPQGVGVEVNISNTNGM